MYSKQQTPASDRISTGDFGLRSMGFLDCVSVRRAPRVVSRRFDSRIREQRVTTHLRSCTEKHVKGLTSLIPPRVLHAKASSRGPPSKLRLFRSAGISTARAAVRSASGGAAANAGSQDNGNGKLFLPQLNHLQEEKKRSEVPPLASSSSQDQQPNRPNPTASKFRRSCVLLSN